MCNFPADRLLRVSWLLLQNMVRSMEVAWLRQWACLLVGSLHPNEEKVLEEVTSRILSAHQLSLTDSQKQRLKVGAMLSFIVLIAIILQACNSICI